MTPGLVIAATSSGSGKTLVTLGLLRALTRQGIAVAGAKVGPDFIDPRFHEAASGRTAYNLDAWAMRPETLTTIAAQAGRDASLVIAEGVMGLFDGIGAEGLGSTADLAAALGWPVILVIDARGAAASLGAMLRGFAYHRADLPIAGVITNRVGGKSHAATVKQACRSACPEIRWLGAVPRDPTLSLPERHLGLVQAREQADLDQRIEHCADLVATHLDLEQLKALAGARSTDVPPASHLIPPLGQRIAVASDDAFSFVYPALLESWCRQGAEISPFSPLADQGPEATADAVYLPGGYPELHAGRLATNHGFSTAMHQAAARGAAIYGECGGYMTLGRTLTDPTGAAHPMLGLLPLDTSFAARRLHLGYRRAITRSASAIGPAGTKFRGHEFHYASIIHEATGSSLFDSFDGQGTALGQAGLIQSNTSGSFLHLIDREEP
jgi:cobyrinic acid a,c-diamide synthase